MKTYTVGFLLAVVAAETAKAQELDIVEERINLISVLGAVNDALE